MTGNGLSSTNKNLVLDCVKLANQRFGLEYSLKIISDHFGLDSEKVISLAKNREIENLKKLIGG